MKKLITSVIIMILACSMLFAQQQPQGQSNGQPQPNMRQQGMQKGIGIMMTCPSMSIMPPQSAMIDRLAQPLGLNATQTENLKTVLDKHQKTLEPLQKKSAEATQLLREAVLNSDYDPEKILEFANNAVKAEVEIINNNLLVWKQIRKILSNEQLKAFQQMMNAPVQPFPGQRFDRDQRRQNRMPNDRSRQQMLMNNESMFPTPNLP